MSHSLPTYQHNLQALEAQLSAINQVEALPLLFPKLSSINESIVIIYSEEEPPG